MKRIFVAIFCAVMMLALSVVPVAADSSGVVGGSFQTQADPLVTATFAGTAMTPQASQTVTVAVNMGEGVLLSSLDTVVLKAYYDADGATNETEFDGKDTPDSKLYAKITWTNGGGPPEFVLDAGTGSWSLGTCLKPADMGGTSGTFTFVFTPGKVATEATGTPTWQLAAKATDGTYDGFDADDEGADMDFYTSISIGGTSLDWGTVPAGLDFGDNTASEKGIGGSITIVANGAYALTAQSAASWTSEGEAADATLDSSDPLCDSAQQFALKCDDTVTYSTAVLLTTSGQSIATGTQTDETGIPYENVTLWLKLSSSFTSDVYTGDVTFWSVNG